MAKRKRPSSHAREREFRKRDRERKKREKAALKRERRQGTLNGVEPQPATGPEGEAPGDQQPNGTHE